MALMNNSNFGIRRQMILSIILILIFAGVNLGISKIGVLIPHLLVAIGCAYIFDSIIKYILKKRIYFDETALITGLIVAFVINPGTSLVLVGLISLVGILSKNFITINKRHIFNPAAFGIVAVGLLFPDIFKSWWALSGISVYVIIILGLFIIYKLGRLSLIISYLLTLFLLKIIYDYFSGDLSFLLSDSWLLLLISFLSSISSLFIFYMLIEPQTSPSTKYKKIIFGIIAAIFSFIFINLQVFSSLAENGLLLGLLVANLYFIISQLYKESQKKIFVNFISIALFITIITYLNPVGNDKILVNNNMNMMSSGSMGSNMNVIKLYKVYTSPKGKDKVRFDIFLSNGKIKNIKTNIIKSNGVSKVYIGYFNNKIGAAVKGKTIKELKNIDTIGGASLTTNAFKEALKNL